MSKKHTKSYKEGEEAFKNGKPNSSNPYECGNLGDNEDRYQWYMGWYDAKLKPLIDKKPSWKESDVLA